MTPQEYVNYNLIFEEEMLDDEETYVALYPQLWTRRFEWADNAERLATCEIYSSIMDKFFRGRQATERFLNMTTSWAQGHETGSLTGKSLRTVILNSVAGWLKFTFLKIGQLPRDESIYMEWSGGRTAVNMVFNPCDSVYIACLQEIQTAFKHVEHVISVVPENVLPVDPTPTGGPENDVTHTHTHAPENDIDGGMDLYQKMVADWSQDKQNIEDICNLDIPLLLQGRSESQKDVRDDKGVNEGTRETFQELYLSRLLLELKMLVNR